jgi:hypothetical protein
MYPLLPFVVFLLTVIALIVGGMRINLRLRTAGAIQPRYIMYDTPSEEEQYRNSGVRAYSTSIAARRFFIFLGVSVLSFGLLLTLLLTAHF